MMDNEAPQIVITPVTALVLMSQILTAVGAALEAAQICPPKVLLDAIRTGCKGTEQPDVIWAADIVVGSAEGAMLPNAKKKPQLTLVRSAGAPPDTAA